MPIILTIIINLLLFLITCGFLLLYFFKTRFSYWSNRGVPYETPSIPFGNMGSPRSRKDPFYITVAKLYTKFKNDGHKYFGIWSGPVPFLVISDLNLIKNIMQKDFSYFMNRGLYFNVKTDPLSGNLFMIENEKWRNLRMKLTPTFTSGKMKIMYQTLLDCSIPLIEEIDKLKDQALDIKELVGCFSTDVIGSCAFGIECNSFKNPDAEFRKYGRKIFDFSYIRTLLRLVTMTFPSLGGLFKLSMIPKDVNDFFIDAVRNTVNFREETQYNRNDFMQLLIELKRKGELGDDELAAQAFIFFLAGFETSSTTMAHCLFELSMNQNIQDKLRKEISNVLGDDGKITYEMLNDMKYLQQVIDETLRKYPSVPFLNRKCVTDYTVPGTDFTISKDTNIMIPVHGIHHDSTYYKDPQQFDPERFSYENREKVLPFSYLPFGEGPRICIGSRFGLMQTKIGLVSILNAFKMTLNEKTPTVLTWNPNGFILKSNEVIFLNAESLQLFAKKA